MLLTSLKVRWSPFHWNLNPIMFSLTLHNTGSQNYLLNLTSNFFHFSVYSAISDAYISVPSRFANVEGRNITFEDLKKPSLLLNVYQQLLVSLLFSINCLTKFFCYCYVSGWLLFRKSVIIASLCHNKYVFKEMIIQ